MTCYLRNDSKDLARILQLDKVLVYKLIHIGIFAEKP